MRDTTCIQSLINEALEGKEEARGVISYLYGVGCHATHGATLASFEDAWETLEKAKAIMDTCHAGMSHQILEQCDPARVNALKNLMNQAEEQIPEAEARLRQELEYVLGLNPGIGSVEDVWELRNHPIHRVQLMSLLATHTVPF